MDSHAPTLFPRDPAIAVAAGGVTPGMVLSLFPGADLLGRGFESAGFCVVRGPDILWGGDVRRFHALPGVFEGVIGGPPCQDFSAARRTPPTGEGLELVREFVRVVEEARPLWFLMENVPRVPDVTCQGYAIQRIDLRANEFGLSQSRLRHFQFGSRDGRVLVIPRGKRTPATAPAALASEGRRVTRRGWAEFCGLMGIEPMDLPGLSVEARYRLVGNGVPLPMARALALCIGAACGMPAGHVCECGCGRPVAGKARFGGAGCRKRVERRRRAASGQVSRDPARSRHGGGVTGGVTGPGLVTVNQAQEV